MGMFDDAINGAGEKPQGKGFERGTHAVAIGEAKSLDKKTQKVDAAAVIEVVVFDKEDNDKQATCTLYFHTEGGAKMSIVKVLGLLAHSVGEDKKEQVKAVGKKLFGDVDDMTKARDIAVKLINDKLVGKEAFLIANPQGNYKTTSYGDIWHYAAENREETDLSTNPLDEKKEAEPDFMDGLDI